MLHEINLCCPDCGGHLWHSLPNLKPDEHCCDNCGSVHSTSEMESHCYEHRE